MYIIIIPITIIKCSFYWLTNNIIDEMKDLYSLAAVYINKKHTI